MANYGSKILGSAVSSLSAQQALITNVGSNIANVNTPGYARRVLSLEARPERAISSNLVVGNGVDIGQLRRTTDKYLDRLVMEARGEFESEKITSEFLERVETIFPLDGSGVPIGSALDNFFGAIRDLSISPASIELRKNVLVEADNLVNSIKSTYTFIADLQNEANNRIDLELKEANSLLSTIAQLNGEIRGIESTGNEAVAERDNRDKALQSLSEKLSFNLVEVPDGSVTLSIRGGFTILAGTNVKELGLHSSPSFLTGGSPPALDGGVLGYIVHDYSGGAGTGHVNLTDRIAAQEGTIPGLLRARGVNDPSNSSAFEAIGILPNLAQRVEAIARALLTDFNAEYLGPDRGTTPGVWAPSSGDLNGNTPATFGFFSVESGASLDADANGYPDLSDLNASSIDSFANTLALAFTSPLDIAAARDSGSGPPAAAVYPAGDGQNMDNLALLQSRSLTLSAGGAYSFNGNLNEGYHELVGVVGNYKNSSRVNLAVAEANLTTSELRQAEVSGVSLNEEFSKTISFQRSFEASSRLVQVTKELFEQIVDII